MGKLGVVPVLEAKIDRLGAKPNLVGLGLKPPGKVRELIRKVSFLSPLPDDGILTMFGARWRNRLRRHWI
jgi:hypothetical protein